jgi:hypothetical protein
VLLPKALLQSLPRSDCTAVSPANPQAVDFIDSFRVEERPLLFELAARLVSSSTLCLDFDLDIELFSTATGPD